MFLDSFRPWSFSWTLVFSILLVGCVAHEGSKPDSSPCKVIDEVPIVIAQSGCWEVDRNLSFNDEDGTAIQVTANNVTIDFLGHVLSGPTSGGSTAKAVRSNGVNRLIVRGGVIDGFFAGVWIESPPPGTGWHIVEGMTISHSTFRGIRVEGVGSVVRKNQIKHIGGTMVFEDSYAMGIEAMGDASEVSANTVLDVRGQGVGEGVGISLSRAREASEIRDNLLVGSAQPSASYGIWLSVGADRTSVNQNYVYGWLFPLAPGLADLNAIRVSGNNFSGNLCGANSLPSRLGWLNEHNSVAPTEFDCPVLVSALRGAVAEDPADAKARYRLAQSQRSCLVEPLPSSKTCERLNEEGIANLRLAGEMGLSEAGRVYQRLLEVGLAH